MKEHISKKQSEIRREAIKKACRGKETHRVILEGQFIHIVRDSHYRLLEQDCINPDIDISLVYTAEYIPKNYHSLKKAKRRCIDKAQGYSGKWHVVKFGRRNYDTVIGTVAKGKNLNIVFTYSAADDTDFREYLVKQFPNKTRSAIQELLTKINYESGKTY